MLELIVDKQEQQKPETQKEARTMQNKVMKLIDEALNIAHSALENIIDYDFVEDFNDNKDEFSTRELEYIYKLALSAHPVVSKSEIISLNDMQELEQAALKIAYAALEQVDISVVEALTELEYFNAKEEQAILVIVKDIKVTLPRAI